jgi:hypothetical protein
MNYTVDDALAQYAAILATIDPSPLLPPKAVYAYPRDKGTIRLSSLPVIIVAERVNVEGAYWTKGADIGQDRWTAEILVYLAEGPLVNDDRAMEMEKTVEAWRWRRVIAKKLMSTLSTKTLNGRADYIGGPLDGQFLSHRTGHIYWLKQQFWGLRIQQVVFQNEVVGA